MNNQRNVKNVIIGVLLVAVFGLSVAYALNVTQLRIEGTANVKSPTRTWAIDITASAVNAVGTNATFDVEPTVTTTGETKNIIFTCSVDAVDDQCNVGMMAANNGNIVAEAKYSTIGLSLTRSDQQVFSNATYNNGQYSISDEYVTVQFRLPSASAVLNPGDSRIYEMSLIVNNLPEEDLTYTINTSLDFEEYVDTASPTNG